MPTRILPSPGKNVAGVMGMTEAAELRLHASTNPNSDNIIRNLEVLPLTRKCRLSPLAETVMDHGSASLLRKSAPIYHVKSDELLDKAILDPSGKEVGRIRDMLVERDGGRVSGFQIEGDADDGSVFLPSGLLRLLDGNMVMKAETGMTETPDQIDFTYGSGLLRTEVFAKPAWRIGLLADFEVDPDGWRLVELVVDVYPEYVITTKAHEQRLPKGYPPVLQIRLPSYWAEFHPSKEGPKARSHVVLKLRGKDLESSIMKRLKEEWFEETRNRSPSDESLQLRMNDVVRQAFDDAFKMS